MAKIDKAFIDEETYPIEASATGNNAFYVQCKEVEHNAPYASCLRHIEKRKEGRLESIFSTCSAAIGRKDCPAVGMRKQEKEAGKAIFFLNRKKRQEFFADGESIESVKLEPWRPSITRTVTAPVRSTSPAPITTPAVAKPATTAPTGNIYADAIGAAMRANSSPVAATLSKSPVTASKMSPLEMLRALRNK